VKGTFFHNVIAIVAHLSHTSAATLVLALALLALIFGLEHLAPNAPTPLIAMGGAIAASALLGLEKLGVETVGSVPRGFPTLAWPDLDLVAQMWPGAAGIAVMRFTETIAAARAFAAPGEPRPVPNQEPQGGGLGRGSDFARYVNFAGLSRLLAIELTSPA